MFNSDSGWIPEVMEARFGHQLTDSREYAWGASRLSSFATEPGSTSAARSRKVAITEGNFVGVALGSTKARTEPTSA